MNFLYIYKEVNPFDIQQSIRVVKKLYPNANIYVIGDKVKIEGVNNIPHKQKEMNRSTRVMVMLLKACGILDEFILMYDDLFLSPKFDLNKYHVCGEIEVKRQMSTGYQMCLKNTKDFLEFHEKPIMKYDCHQPMKIISREFLEMAAHVNWYNEHVLPKTLYGNWFNKPYTIIENLKCNSLSDMKRKYNEYGCFSTVDDIKSEVKEFILSLPDCQS